MSVTSSVRKILHRVYQTVGLGRRMKNHPLLPTAQAVNRVASRHGLPFQGWDETAGSLSWKVPRDARNWNTVAAKARNRVVVKAAIVQDDGVERIVVGLREEIVDLPVDTNGTKGGLARFNWRAAFAFRPQSGKFFLELQADLATLEQRSTPRSVSFSASTRIARSPTCWRMRRWVTDLPPTINCSKPPQPPWDDPSASPCSKARRFGRRRHWPIAPASD